MITRTDGYLALADEYVTADDPGDPWGTVMGWLFAIAGTLAADGEDVPPTWGYRRSPIDHRTVAELADEDAGGMRGDYEENIVAGGYLDGSWDADDLRAFGNVLDRYASWCKLAGVDY